MDAGVAAARLLIVGAFRTNELYAEHPLHKFILDLKTAHPIHFLEIQLQALQQNHMVQWLGDSFQFSGESAAQLAEALLIQTQGKYVLSLLYRTRKVHRTELLMLHVSACFAVHSVCVHC
jgi:hypothetical protein